MLLPEKYYIAGIDLNLLRASLIRLTWVFNSFWVGLNMERGGGLKIILNTIKIESFRKMLSHTQINEVKIRHQMSY